MLIDLLSGGLAGIVSRTGIAPLELYKIQRQAAYIEHATLRNVLKKEGIRYLWKGNMTNCTRIAPQMAINYSVFEYSKKHIKMENKDINNLVCGALAGSVSMACIYPLETVRSRLSLQMNSSHYSGILNCLKTMPFNEMYRGLWMSLLGYTPYCALNFAFYNKLKDNFEEMEMNKNANKLLSGGFSAMMAVSITYPTDLMRRQLQLQGFDKSVPKYDGIIDCGKKIIKTQGIRGLYKGLLASYICIFPKFALQFWSFELFQENIKKCVVNI